MSSTTICIMITIFVYLVGMLLIGFHYAKKNESSSDFYLGGRKLGPLVTAMSAEASDMSSYLLMGLPGLAYLSGLADVGWTAIGLAVGTYLNWLFTAKRLRRYTHITGSFTLPQFFSRRYRDEKSILSAIAAIIIIIFFIPYTASGFAACGKLFHALFGANYMTTMIISAIVIVAYTAAGGFLAASMTDFIQSIIMTVALLFVLIFATVSAGGVDAVMENAKALPGYLSLTSTYVADSGSSQSYNLLHIITTVSWGLGYFGMPHILLRFMAINDEKNLKLSRRVASIWVTIAMGIAVCIGIVGKELSNTGAIAQLSGNNTETIIVKVADLLSKHGILPALMAGLVLSRHSGQHHVHGGLPAACRVLQRIRKPAAGDAASEHLREKEHAGRPDHRGHHRHSGRHYRPEFGQLRVRHRLLCLGRLRRWLWSAGHLLPVLEAHDAPRRDRWHGRRRRNGLYLEIPGQAPGRCVRCLRASARVPGRLAGHRHRQPLHQGPGAGRDGRVRKSPFQRDPLSTAPAYPTHITPPFPAAPPGAVGIFLHFGLTIRPIFLTLLPSWHTGLGGANVISKPPHSDSRPGAASFLQRSFRFLVSKEGSYN